MKEKKLPWKAQYCLQSESPVCYCEELPVQHFQVEESNFC